MPAYTIDFEDINGDPASCIRYADTADQVRQDWADEFSCDPDDCHACTRSDWADAYAPGPVPDDVLLDHDWNLSCRGCECSIDKGITRRVKDRHGNLYCSQYCLDRDVAYFAMRDLVADAPALENITDGAVLDIKHGWWRHRMAEEWIDRCAEYMMFRAHLSEDEARYQAEVTMWEYAEDEAREEGLSACCAIDLICLDYEIVWDVADEAMSYWEG